MEKTFVQKMERDYKAKCDEANESVTAMMETVDKRLAKMCVSCNAQMDEIHDRQQEVIDENNRLYKDIESMKLEIVKLESRNENRNTTESIPIMDEHEYTDDLPYT